MHYRRFRVPEGKVPDARPVSYTHLDVYKRQEEKGADIYKPSGLHNFSLYLGGKWYSLTAKAGTYKDVYKRQVPVWLRCVHKSCT